MTAGLLAWRVALQALPKSVVKASNDFLSFMFMKRTLLKERVKDRPSGRCRWKRLEATWNLLSCPQKNR